VSYGQRVIIQCLHKEKVHPAQIHRRLSTQYGLETYSFRSVQHWHQLFDCKRQNLHDDPRSGRPPIDHLDAKIITCVEREPFSSAYSLAEALDMSPATVLSRLRNSLGMKSFHLGWVPHQLTDNLRETDDLWQVKAAKCSELLRALEAIQRIHFRHIITSQAMRAGFSSNISTPHNGWFLATKCLKGWTWLSAPLSLCSRLLEASTNSTC
jgi:hypothetical protein